MNKIADAFKEYAVRAFFKAIRSVRTGVVARVVSYDPKKQTAKVHPTVPETDTVEGVERELGVADLPRIPVAHHGGSLRGLTFGLERDDTVLLVARHRSHAEVDNGANTPVSPQSSARMQLSEMVAIPGYTPENPGQADAHFRADGQPVLYMDAGEALHLAIANADRALARADLVEQRLTAIINAFNSHTHTGVTTGMGSSGAPAAPITGSNDVASSRIKVDS